MIVESAFYKLPELLLGHSYPREQYESAITTQLALGLLSELNSRNVPQPTHRIQIERPYPSTPGGASPGRADLYVDLAGLYTHHLSHLYSLYGMKPDNWLEVKFFGGIGRATGEETTTENAAVILQDLLRLCLYVREERSADRTNARYFLCVFNRVPQKYLALRRRGAGTSERSWIPSLLSQGPRRTIAIPLAEEPPTFRKAMGPVIPHDDPEARLSLDVVSWSFEPAARHSELLYWGYLVRILACDIHAAGLRFVYDDISTEMWTVEQQQTQGKMVGRVLGRSARSGLQSSES